MEKASFDNKLNKMRVASVIIGALLIHFSIGIVYTFGNIMPYIYSYIHRRTDQKISLVSMLWIQTCMASPLPSMWLGGYLEKKMGGRKSAMIGVFLYTSGIALTYFTIQKSFALLLVTFGLMNGFGQGITFNTVLIVVHQWLTKHVGFGTGIVIAGFGIHGFVFSPLQTYFVNQENYKAVNGIFIQDDLLDRVPQLFLLLATIFIILQFVGLILLDEPTASHKSEARKHEEKRTDTIKDNILSSTFVLLFFTLLFCALGTQIINGFYKTFGQQFIKDDYFLASVASSSAISNCFGRIFWGKLADVVTNFIINHFIWDLWSVSVQLISYQASMACVTAIASFIMFTLGIVKITGLQYFFMVWVSIMFSCIGGFFVLVPYAANKCFGAERVGLMYGAIQISVGIAGISAPFTARFVLDVMSFEILFNIVGCMYFIAFILTALIHLTKYGKPYEPHLINAEIDKKPSAETALDDRDKKDKEDAAQSRADDKEYKELSFQDGRNDKDEGTSVITEGQKVASPNTEKQVTFDTKVGGDLLVKADTFQSQAEYVFPQDIGRAFQK